MNPVLRARLGLEPDARLRLSATRGLIYALDGLSRLSVGRPFFGLKQSETLMEEIAGRTGPDLVASLLACRGQTQLDLEGRSHVPPEGPVIIAATHPSGMFDYIAHAGALLDLRPDLKVVATAEATQFLAEDNVVTVQVDKSYRSTSSRATVAAMRSQLDAGGALLVFGSGRVSHRINGYLQEPDWRSGPTRVSELCNAPLIPAASDATNSGYYYSMRGLARRLSGDEHIGALFGSVRHIAEFMEKLGGHYTVRYGAPLPPGTAPEVLKSAAEGLFPGMYGPVPPQHT